jgi:hypothetical protein
MEGWQVGLVTVVSVFLLGMFWKAYFHPSSKLARQAANMNWRADGREDDDGYKNIRYRRGALTAVVPFKNPSVVFSHNGEEKVFTDFIELEQWIGGEIEREKIDLEVRVNMAVADFSLYDFERAGSDISKNEITTIFDEFLERIDVGDTHGEMEEFLKRCAQSLRAVMYYSEREGDFDAELIADRFCYAMHMIDVGFFDYIYDENKARETQRIGWKFEAGISVAAKKVVQEIFDNNLNGSFFEFISDYDPFEDDVWDFWENRPSLVEDILSVRNDTFPEGDKSFVFGFESPEEPDIDSDGEADLTFADYAYVQYRLLNKEDDDPVRFLEDTKFIYTPIFVRFFFNPNMT